VEAQNLARIGVKELILIAQELTYYGLDIYKKRSLPELLNALCEVEGIEWIRLHYAYPSKFPLEVLDTMASQKKICNYLDIPLQHASDPVLKRMRRQITNNETIELLNEAKKRVPGLTIRTTFLVGFPGETEKDFENLISFVQKTEFDRIGVFQYSHEENTSAYEMEDDVPEEIKTERANRLMEVQKDISYQKNVNKIGQKLKILVDRKEGGYFYGRTEADSPEVDNEVQINAKENYVRVGDFCDVEIIDALEYELIGKII